MFEILISGRVLMRKYDLILLSSLVHLSNISVILSYSCFKNKNERNDLVDSNVNFDLLREDVVFHGCEYLDLKKASIMLAFFVGSNNSDR